MLAGLVPPRGPGVRPEPCGRKGEMSLWDWASNSTLAKLVSVQLPSCVTALAMGSCDCSREQQNPPTCLLFCVFCDTFF